MSAYGRVAVDGVAHYARFDGQQVLLDGAPWSGGKPARAVPTTARRLAPVVPGKIVCVGRNYAAHAKELGNEVPTKPKLFMKPPSAVIGPDDVIELPSASALVHHEGELAVVIGQRAKDVHEASALEHVFGYTCANDVTARDLQREDKVFTRAKGFDTFCPLGPQIETDLDPVALDVGLVVTREGMRSIKQAGNTRDMVFSVAHIVAYVSAIMTLEPGDVILTGTPEGVDQLVGGDTVEVTVAGIGTLRNTVSAR